MSVDTCWDWDEVDDLRVWNLSNYDSNKIFKFCYSKKEILREEGDNQWMVLYNEQ